MPEHKAAGWNGSVPSEMASAAEVLLQSPTRVLMVGALALNGAGQYATVKEAAGRLDVLMEDMGVQHPPFAYRTLRPHTVDMYAQGMLLRSARRGRTSNKMIDQYAIPPDDVWLRALSGAILTWHHDYPGILLSKMLGIRGTSANREHVSVHLASRMRIVQAVLERDQSGGQVPGAELLQCGVPADSAEGIVRQLVRYYTFTTTRGAHYRKLDQIGVTVVPDLRTPLAGWLAQCQQLVSDPAYRKQMGEAIVPTLHNPLACQRFIRALRAYNTNFLLPIRAYPR